MKIINAEILQQVGRGVLASLMVAVPSALIPYQGIPIGMWYQIELVSASVSFLQSPSIDAFLFWICVCSYSLLVIYIAIEVSNLLIAFLGKKL